MNSRLDFSRASHTASGATRSAGAHVSRTVAAQTTSGERLFGALMAGLLVLWMIVAPPPGDVSTHADTYYTDLTTNLEVDSSAYNGQRFTMTGTVRNVSNVTADDVTVTFAIAGNLQELSVTCTDPQWGAVCPTEGFAVTVKSNDATATAVIPTMPGNSSLTLAITGRWGWSQSVNATLKAELPEGDLLDSDPATNFVQQGVSLVVPVADIIVTKTQDKVVVASGETRTYTLTYENTSDYDAGIDIDDRFRYESNASLPSTQWNGRTLSGKGGGGPEGVVSWSVSCVPEASSGVDCPAAFNGTTSSTSFDSNGSRLIPFSTRFNLPAHSKLVLSVPVTVTLSQCISGNKDFLVVQNTLNAKPWNSRLVDFTKSNIPVLGAVVGEKCQQITVRTTKTQDKTVIESGQTITYTVTYTNPSDYTVSGLGIQDSFSTNNSLTSPISWNGIELSGTGGTATTTLSYSVSCAPETSASVTCPSVFDGHAESTKTYFFDSNYSASTENSYLGQYDVTLPPHSQLVLTIPVTVTLNGCIKNKNFVAWGNTSRILQGSSGSVYWNQTMSTVKAALVGNQCQETTVQVTKTQDKDILLSGETITYTVTYENTGDFDISMSRIVDYLRSSSGDLPETLWAGRTISGKGTQSNGNISYKVLCSDQTSSNVPCRTYFDGRTQNGSVSSSFNYLVSLSDKLVLPAHSKLVLTIPVTPSFRTCVPDYIPLYNSASIDSRVGADVTFTNASASQYAAVMTNDASVRTTVSADGGATWGGELAAGDQALLRVAMSNSCSMTPAMPFTVNLPAGGVMSPAEHAEAVSYGVVPSGSQPFTYTCRLKAKDGTISSVACPADIKYDPDTHSITGTWPTAISSGEEAFIDVNFFVGLQEGDVLRSYVAESDVTGIGGDINYASNTAQDTFWVRNLAAVPPRILLPVTGGTAADMFIALGGLTLGGAVLTVWWMRVREQRKANALARASRTNLL